MGGWNTVCWTLQREREREEIAYVVAKRTERRTNKYEVAKYAAAAARAK